MLLKIGFVRGKNGLLNREWQTDTKEGELTVN
jgi:hypothetical protein